MRRGLSKDFPPLEKVCRSRDKLTGGLADSSSRPGSETVNVATRNTHCETTSKSSQSVSGRSRYPGKRPARIAHLPIRAPAHHTLWKNLIGIITSGTHRCGSSFDVCHCVLRSLHSARSVGLKSSNELLTAPTLYEHRVERKEFTSRTLVMRWQHRGTSLSTPTSPPVSFHPSSATTYRARR